MRYKIILLIVLLLFFVGAFASAYVLHAFNREWYLWPLFTLTVAISLFPVFWMLEEGPTSFDKP